MKSDSGYRIEARFNPYRIEQDLLYCHDDLVHKVRTQVIDLQDRSIREALIAIGWTPPPGDKP